MYYTGFADEAGSSIDIQIRATKELGWEYIEARSIDGVNITDIPDKKFDEVCEKLGEAGVKINCFGSAVANWAKDPRSKEDFERSVEELKRAIPRMHRLGTRMIRGMSFAMQKAEPADNPELERTIFEKLNYLVKLCEDNDILYLHENCANYGGQSYLHTLRLIDNIKSPAFKILFDTGNPVITENRIGAPPYLTMQDSWEFYSNIKEFIYYVHIKDGVFVAKSDGIFNKARYTFPGEGDGHVVEIVEDLLKNGYDGGFSIEPHMASVFHEDDSRERDDEAYKIYVEYGKRFMKIVEDIKGKLSK